jgi:hypothetical protein
MRRQSLRRLPRSRLQVADQSRRRQLPASVAGEYRAFQVSGASYIQYSQVFYAKIPADTFSLQLNLILTTILNRAKAW